MTKIMPNKNQKSGTVKAGHRRTIWRNQYQRSVFWSIRQKFGTVTFHKLIIIIIIGIPVESTEWLLLYCFQVELEFGNVGFCGGRKTGVPGEKPLEQGREPTTNSTHI